jgi:hypothetical protein
MAGEGRRVAPASTKLAGSHGSDERPRLRPALFARFGDLTKLRYDFPLVLVAGGDGPYVEPLSARVDSLLGAIAPSGLAGERLRRAVLHLEREIRSEVSQHGRGPLESAWDAGAERLIHGGAALAGDLAHARETMPLAGELVDCDAMLPARFVAHAWSHVQERRRQAVLGLIERLESGLDGMVRADFLRSAAGREAAQLRAGVGTAQQSLFDFEAMERLLRRPSGVSGLSDTRRRRIAEILDTLRDRRLFGSHCEDDFAFASVDSALSSYDARMPEMLKVVRTIAFAELVTQGRVVEPRHEVLLRGGAAAGSWPNELQLFPDYLVRIGAGASDRKLAGVLSALGSGAALKVLVAIDDPFGLTGRLAEAAMGLGNVFVLQTAASHLYAVRDRVLAALEYRGPALLTVYTPPARLNGGRSGIPGYLASAAAIESRAVPAFSYDPSAGAGWAQRFSLFDNPQPERPWPIHGLTYSDRAMERVTEEVAFTAADFALCDPRWSAYFASPTPDQAEEGRVPIDAWLAERSDAIHASVPFVYAFADAPGTLEKLVVDERLAHMIRLRSDAWSRLCELEALKLVRADPVTPAVAIDVGNAQASPEQSVVAGAAAEGATVGAVPAASDHGATRTAVLADDEADGAISPPGGDDPYIETPRCTSCNECTGINSRMFSYDENRQAFIADAGAGTYAELVEAAERCQVAIIHPGKPRNPNEPGLEALLRRGAAFA